MLGDLTPVISLPLIGGSTTDTAPDYTVVPDDLTSFLARIEIVAQGGVDPEAIPFHNHNENAAPNAVSGWDSYIGQQPLKDAFHTKIAAADARGKRLPHSLLATGMPGAGKTTIAQVVADDFGVRMVKLVPPFTIETLWEAAQTMNDWEILFIDEIHMLDRRMQDCLLTIMEEGRLYIQDDVIDLAEFSVFGATTDADLLADAVISRFAFRPDTGARFVPYTDQDCYEIAKNFASPRNLNVDLSEDTLRAIAGAAQGTPRIVRDMVDAAGDLLAAHGDVTGEQVLASMGVEPDGLTHNHRAYLTWVYQFGRRQKTDKDGFIVEVKYMAGQRTLETALRLPSAGVFRIERLLIDRGLVTKEGAGRRLTDRGILRAIEFIERGEGHAVK
jgi:Holliday junction resolvasome RuvABC ATP-dependent DNA helicase subunit